jgi:hypothetical protein
MLMLFMSAYSFTLPPIPASMKRRLARTVADRWPRDEIAFMRPPAARISNLVIDLTPAGGGDSLEPVNRGQTGCRVGTLFRDTEAARPDMASAHDRATAWAFLLRQLERSPSAVV